MRNFKLSYQRLSHIDSDVSIHYLVSRNGLIFNLLCPNFKAWHAGKSKWKNLNNINNYSIGIELQNKGHQYGYSNFTNKQYSSLSKLVSFLKKNFYILDQNIIFHSDISPNRKKDPGEKFFIDKIGITRFKKIKKTTNNLSVKSLLEIYGFNIYYINNYEASCIKAVKRTLNYKKITANITKKFIKDFYNLLFY